MSAASRKKSSASSSDEADCLLSAPLMPDRDLWEREGFLPSSSVAIGVPVPVSDFSTLTAAEAVPYASYTIVPIEASATAVEESYRSGTYAAFPSDASASSSASAFASGYDAPSSRRRSSRADSLPPSPHYPTFSRSSVGTLEDATRLGVGKLESEERLIALGIQNALLQSEEDNRWIREEANRVARMRDEEGLQCVDPHRDLMFRKEMEKAVSRKMGGGETEAKAERKEDERTPFEPTKPFGSKPYECSEYQVAEYSKDAYEYKSVYEE